MKKLLYLLLLVPFGFLTSCDKEDLASFDMTLTLSGVTQSDGYFYAVAGDAVTIQSLDVRGTDGKNTTVANVFFYLNNAPLFPDPWELGAPISFSTEGLQPGIYTIGIVGNLLQVDQPIQNFASNYKLVIVGNEEDLPENAPELGSYSVTINFSK